MALNYKLTEISANKMFGGIQKVFNHESKTLGCKMNLAVYFPPQYDTKSLPVLYWLSGLSCNETNFIYKSGAQGFAAQYGIIIVCPDTSPRGLNIPGDKDAWDFGEGAGMYLNAIVEPWKNNYRMFDYVTMELIDLVNTNFNVSVENQSIMGHSMGGHGALICALKNPGLYKSVSAMAPISNPCEAPWGKKAFNGYLGPRETGKWNEWDATELLKNYDERPIVLFIDQGLDDQFYLDKQLLPENLVEVCKESKFPVIYKKREGYDHSYYYVATFIEEHIAYHAKYLLVE